MEKEIRVKLSTAIYLFIIFILIIALGVVYYLGFVVKEKENINNENKTNNTDIVISKNEEENKTIEDEELQYNAIKNDMIDNKINSSSNEQIKDKEESKKDNLDNNKTNNNNDTIKISKSERKKLVEEYYNIATGDIWSEFKYSEFDDNESKAEITNYSKVMKNRFTKQGKKVFEEENKKGLLTIKNGKAYIAAGSEHTGEYLKSLKFKDIKQKDNTITATVVRTMTETAIIDMDKEELEKAETYTLEDEFIIKSENGKWLIDKFSWFIDEEKRLIEEYYNIATGDIWSEFKYSEFDYDGDGAEITNYNKVMNDRFTKKGKKVFEEENKKCILVLKNEKAYMAAGGDHTGEYLKSLKFEDIKQEDDTITATVVRTMTETAIVDMNKEELEKAKTYTLKDEFVLKLVNGKWLIDNFSWFIE